MARATAIKTSDLQKLLTGITIDKWINEEKAADLMGMKKKSFQNLIYAGKIPEEAIKVGVNGVRFFDKEILIGLNEKAPVEASA